MRIEIEYITLCKFNVVFREDRLFRISIDVRLLDHYYDNNYFEDRRKTSFMSDAERYGKRHSSEVANFSSRQPDVCDRIVHVTSSAASVD